MDAQELWVRYEQLTAPLSQLLCEELRLILQPTQAAKLKYVCTLTLHYSLVSSAGVGWGGRGLPLPCPVRRQLVQVHIQ